MMEKVVLAGDLPPLREKFRLHVPLVMLPAARIAALVACEVVKTTEL